MPERLQTLRKVPVLVNGDYQNPVGYLELRGDIELYEGVEFAYAYVKEGGGIIQLHSLLLVYPPVVVKREEDHASQKAPS